jgi:hypothetical protein
MATLISNYLKSEGLLPPSPSAEANVAALDLGKLAQLSVYPRSIAATRQSVFFLGRRDQERVLGILSAKSKHPSRFEGETRDMVIEGIECILAVCPTTSANAASLREILRFLAPRPLGLEKSVGCGDRLGLATPGHVRAVRNSDMAPIFAQQSMRENARTGRTPQQVIDDAVWGVFQEGWRNGYGADADHLKTSADIDLCAAAGYTFYTIDPGEYVDNGANTAPVEGLRDKLQDLPWTELESSWNALEQKLGQKPIDLGNFKLSITTEELMRAAAKYGRVVAHTTKMFRHLAAVMGMRRFELEMSVDETETVTSLAEHVYIAHELKRLGVRWISLAPRYVGTFEKGVDYIGDLGAFEESFARHLAVSKTFGPYKLSLHSGSDKFSIYPVASRVAGSLVHLKTAGTSYLEALRAIAQINPEVFRGIVAFAIDRYPTDRATYHVSAEIAKIPDAVGLRDHQLATLLDDFHAREVLHVTFGSVLNHPIFREAFFDVLKSEEEVYYGLLEQHFTKHLAPFREAAGVSSSGA